MFRKTRQTDGTAAPRVHSHLDDSELVESRKFVTVVAVKIGGHNQHAADRLHSRPYKGASGVGDRTKRKKK